ncbi:MAG: RIP metalloprotease RseP [Candidatus Omnitrophica bacterium]|nr:RIP metalloprotease RseP [Candidatus Omnitrophota bacterium]
MSIVIFLLVLSVLIVSHEFGHFLVARWRGVRVEKFAIGFGPPIIKLKLKDLDFLICAVPLGGYVKLAGEAQEEFHSRKDEFLAKPLKDRAMIIAAGPTFNYILAWLVFSFVFIAGFPSYTNKIGKVLDNYPAKTAGLKPGDRIIKVNGEKIELWQELADKIHKAKTEIKVTILRQGKTIELSIKPKQKSVKDLLGRPTRISFLGITPAPEFKTVPYPFFLSFAKGFKHLIQLSWLTLQSLFYILTGKLSFKDSVSGPLGIYYVTAQASHMGLGVLLHLVGVLSMSLAIFNFLPIPILDGGHLFFLGLEKIRGRALSAKSEEVITKFALAFLVALFLFVSYSDMIKFGSKIFVK